MAGRPARLSGFPVLVRSQARRRRTQEAADSDRRRASESARDASYEQADHEHAREDPGREDELELLIAQVREARERLGRLIATLRADRPDWKDREQRWARWRTEAKRRLEGSTSDPKVKVH